MKVYFTASQRGKSKGAWGVEERNHSSQKGSE